jgi:hypothetical protein
VEHLLTFGRRGVMCRKEFIAMRKSAVRIQAFIRMKNERPKYLKALNEKKQQDNMAFQLQKLQERLHEEQRRNADMKKERESDSTRDSLLYVESNGTRSRGKSSAHMWMADADGIINQLNDETSRLRRENEEQRIMMSSMKNEVDRLKSEKEVQAANHHVKIRQLEDMVRQLFVSS